jgi:CRP-like cAMP-binding protein
MIIRRDEVACASADALRAWGELRATGVSITLRPRQTLPLVKPADGTLYAVDAGLLLLVAVLAGRNRQGLALLYPGDIVPTAHLPAQFDAELFALRPSKVSKLRWTRPTNHEHVQALVDARCADFAARTALHAAAMGALTGPERLATLLVELGSRIGLATREGVLIEAPLLRTEMAAHLSLNSDTVSRGLSQLRVRGVVETTGRNRIVIRDWAGLCALSPIALAVTGSTASFARIQTGVYGVAR